MKPRIKPYSQIVETAAELMDMPVFEAELEMDSRLRKLAIPKIAVTIYVNWASHNALTHQDLAEALGLTVTTVRSHLNKIKRKFPWLFYFGPHPQNVRGCGHIDMNWIEAETRRLMCQ